MKYLIITDYLDFVGGGFEPLGVLYIASAVRAAGHEVRMIPDKYEEAAATIASWQPDFVGYCVYTGYHKPLLDLNRRLKERFHFHSVFGGPHATFFPEIIEEEGVDMVCRGEGEWAMVEMIERVQKGEDYADVRNFWIKQNGHVHQNEVRPPEPEIEKFPFPAHDMFYQFPEVRNNKIRVVVTARGCPYSCTYCYNYKIKEMYRGCGVPHLRHREVDGVIEEIKWIRDNYPIELIYFGTDCFTASEKWVLEFSEKYSRELRIPFTASTRPETTTVAGSEALKEAGCVCMLMGIESGNEDIRLNLLNRKMSNEKILQAADIIHKAGLNLFTFNMMAFPGETLKQAFDTMYLNIKTKTDYTWVSLFQPYPRTKLGEYAMEKGYFDGNYDELPESWYKDSVLKNPQKKELIRLRPLVSLGVEFPYLAWLIKILVKLPLTPLYSLLWKVHKAYCYRYRVMPVKLSVKEVMRLSWKYLFDRSQR
jgi:radical SAM superfamily enzyme YgiQ (UPF0313 family)